MKKRIILLVLAFAFLLSACGSKESKKEYKIGEYTDYGYESEYLGYKFKCPEGFVLTTREQIAQISQISLDLISDDVSELQKAYTDLAVIYEMMATNTLTTSNVVITLEKNLTDSSLDKYIDSFKAQTKTMTTMEFSLNDEITTEELAGCQYKVINAVVGMSGVTMNQIYYFREVGDRFMTMTITYRDNNESDKDAILNAFTEY